MDHDIVADEAHLGAAAHQTFRHAATGHLADLGDREHFQHFGVAEEGFANLRRQHAGQHGFDVVHHIVDDVVVADFDAVALGAVARLRIGADIEADDGAARGMGQDHIGFGDGANAGLQDLNRDFIGVELGQRALDGFDRPLHIGLDDERQKFGLAVLPRLQKLIEGLTRRCGMTRLAALARAIFGDLAGPRLIFDHDEFIAGLRHARQAENFHRQGRAGALDGLAAIIDKGAHAAPFRTGDQNIALMQRAALDQNRGDRATALVELGFDHGTFGDALRIGLEVEDFGLQQDRILKRIEIGALERRDFDRLGFAAHLFDLNVVLQQLCLDAHCDRNQACRSC